MNSQVIKSFAPCKEMKAKHEQNKRIRERAKAIDFYLNQALKIEHLI